MVHFLEPYLKEERSELVVTRRRADGAGRFVSPVAVFAVIIFCLTAGGQAMGAEAKPVSFRYNFPEGKELTYKISVDGHVEVQTPMGSETNPIHVEMRMRQTFVEATDVLAKVRMEVLSARTFQGSQSAPLPEEGQVSEMTLDRQGRVTYLSGAGAWQGSEFAHMIFPDEPLKPGDSWVQATESKLGTAVQMKTRYTLSGFAKTDGWETAQFTPELAVDNQGGHPTDPHAMSRGRTYFSMELGQVVQTVADTRFSFRMPLPQDPSVIITSITTIHTEMKLVGGW